MVLGITGVVYSWQGIVNTSGRGWGLCKPLARQLSVHFWFSITCKFRPKYASVSCLGPEARLVQL